MPRSKASFVREKNIVLFLVEGDSDRTALELPINALFDSVNPRLRVIFAQQHRKGSKFDISCGYNTDGFDDDTDDVSTSLDEKTSEENKSNFGGDITSNTYVTPNNIELKITNRFFKPLVEKEKIYSKMICKVIHIVDLDGIYIPDSHITHFSDEHLGRERPFYDGENGIIECNDLANIVLRNGHKRANLEYLQSLSSIKIETKSVPYSIYYFSSNLDHFLHNDPNLAHNKTQLAEAFMMNYIYDTDGFVRFFSDADSSSGMSYEESWEYVKEGTNSIKRHTNIDLMLSDILNNEFWK